MIYLKTPEEIDSIARGGSIIAKFLVEIQKHIVPGVSTMELNVFADNFIRSHDGAEPAFKGLYGFSGSICISLNEEVVHGIPNSSRILAEGDIISIDVGVKLEGWCSDSAWTFPVGEVDEQSSHLLTVTEESLNDAITATVKDNHVGDIGVAVMNRVEGTGLHIIRDLVGHGLGREVHEEPQVSNIGGPGIGPLLREGLVIAIEPMLALGTDKIRTLEDHWTVVTEDGTRSAHFEHTVAITANGPRILTANPADIFA